MIQVNGVKIEESDIGQEMQYHATESQRESMIKASESLIVSEFIRQEAKNSGLEIDSNDAYVDSLLEKEVNFPEATESECEAYYEQNKNQFVTPPLLSVRHILIGSSPEDETARSLAREQGEEVLAQLRKHPESFCELAKHHSMCPSSEVGGNLGQISRGQTVPEFERQLFNCQQGLVDAPLESRYGIHIVDITRREEGQQLPYEAVSDKISTYLNEKVRHKAIAQYISTLIDKASIEGFDFEQGDPNFFH